MAASTSAAAAPESAAAASERPVEGAGNVCAGGRLGRAGSGLGGGALGARRVEAGAATRVESALGARSSAGTDRGREGMGEFSCVMGKESAKSVRRAR